MIRKCRVEVEFEFDDEDCDSLGDAEWEALSYLAEHLMDDEEDCSLDIKEIIIE